jgi:hypothetical protein
VLLVFAAPSQLPSLAGREQRPTIPLPDFDPDNALLILLAPISDEVRNNFASCETSGVRRSLVVERRRE